MNVFTVSGRCVADGELRTTNSNDQVLSFRMANDVGWGDRKHVNWIDCSYWGKRAAAVAPYVLKGGKITVSGELKLETYQKKDGSEASKLSLRVQDLDLGARQDSDNRESSGSSRSGSDQRRSGGGNRGGGGRDYDDDRSSRSGGRGSSGGKPAFDQDLDDEIPF